jgi:hypothetical protein
MKFEKAFEAFAAFLETLSVAMTAANSINPVVNFFRCTTDNDADDHRIVKRTFLFVRAHF